MLTYYLYNKRNKSKQKQTDYKQTALEGRPVVHTRRVGQPRNNCPTYLQKKKKKKKVREKNTKSFISNIKGNATPPIARHSSPSDCTV